MRRFVLAASILLLLVIALAGGATFVAGSSFERSGPGGDRQQVAAPIDKIDVLVRESNPLQVTVKITAGLPGGCAQQGSYDLSRSGDTITINVRNSMPRANLVCTAIYGTYEINVDIGSSFALGSTYTVHVNDKTTTFKT